MIIDSSGILCLRSKPRCCSSSAKESILLLKGTLLDKQTADDSLSQKKEEKVEPVSEGSISGVRILLLLKKH